MDSPTWRVTLTCGCVYSLAGAPDLRRPLICGVKVPPDFDAPTVTQTHGLRMITKAERVENGQD